MDNWLSLDGAVLQASAPMGMMRRVVDQALLLVPSAQGAVVELADGSCMTYVCCAGSLSKAVGLRLDIATSLSGLAVRTGATLRCDDASTDERVDREACRKVGAISMVCVPLRRDERAVGVLKVSSAKARAFDDEDEATLGALAEFITAAITTAAELSQATDNLLHARGRGPGSLSSPHRSAKTSRFVANVLQPGLADDFDARLRTEAVLATLDFDIVYQPKFELARGTLAAVEALARFRPEPYRAPNLWFDDARRVGLGAELEIAAVSKALAQAHRLPDCRIAVNVGPEVLQHPACLEVLHSFEPTRLIVELTEHVEVDNYPLLRRLLTALRRRGVRLAVDDTGSGFSSLSHIVKLAPDIIKLDIELVRGIDIDPVRRSLATAVLAFARDTGAKVTAEGIETEGELEVLRSLGTDYGQGYLLGRPVPPEDVPLRHPSAVQVAGLSA